jgi:heavy metal sensor kinase
VKHWSIHARLTLWYGAALAASLALLGIGIWWTLEKSLYRDIDQRLQDHVTETGRIVARELAEHDRGEALEEIRESLSLSPGELSAVCDPQGSLIYRAPELDFTCPQNGSGYSGLQIRNEPFRSLLARHDTYTIYVATSTRHILSALDRLRWILLLSIPAVLIIATAGGYWLSVRAMAQVEEIARTARTIGMQNLSQRLPVPETGDALQRLSETLNEMFARLEGAFQRVSQFTADAAHELRTPLALIRTTAEVALRSGQPNEYKEALPQIVEETARTTELVQNLLVLARADTGAYLQTSTPFQLDNIVHEVIESARKLAATREIALTAPTRFPPFEIQGDSTAMRRLLLILLDNAIKYTPQGGRVTISLIGSAVEIADTGIGIAARDLPHIFERFYRADKARSRDSGGAGLGLSLAKWIAEAHRATITVESHPGQGSKFRLNLPSQ